MCNFSLCTYISWASPVLLCSVSRLFSFLTCEQQATGLEGSKVSLQEVEWRWLIQTGNKVVTTLWWTALKRSTCAVTGVIRRLSLINYGQLLTIFFHDRPSTIANTSINSDLPLKRALVPTLPIRAGKKGLSLFLSSLLKVTKCVFYHQCHLFDKYTWSTTVSSYCPCVSTTYAVILGLWRVCWHSWEVSSDTYSWIQSSCILVALKQ